MDKNSFNPIFIALGWERLFANSSTFVYKDSMGITRWVISCGGFDNDKVLIMIKCVHDHYVNLWEDSECHFYGWLKDEEDLKKVMEFLEI